ncbi:invasion associated locus B family protein [Tranquillimonas alkanivorans]|uniref:Invasion protein IalB, involved in pathogenesis n=1 Tax=Tranquillimonas alkanivorans TaxID=441119 RepID=A0A1I5L283_9RHOB|nr:invasion associated locus B family protein [Tranquillimonas alkanivorans]SFO91298.1 Invasion protein IalB, involved in pathogenesis [Tranquillimonas alkanivorans]
MKTYITRVLAGVALAGAAVPAMAQDESTNRVAVETAWSVFVESDPKECWVVSVPKETVNTKDGRVVAVRRGDILLFVTYRGDGDGEVSFTGGYPFADGSTVNLDIGGTEYEMFTEGEWAWPSSDAQDAEIIASMKAGADAVLTARSSRGTTTEDTFSLFGFTAATDEAADRCSG